MIHLATFADGDWGIRKAGARLIREAKKSNLFSSTILYALEDLNEIDNGFSQKHFDFIQRNPRGFGFCFWKPTYLLRALSELNDDDILVSLDAGCQLNINSRSISRFNEYIEIAHESHGLFMQLRNNQFGIADLSDSNWSNSLIVNKLEPTFEALQSNQIQAGILIIRNSPEIRNLLQEWKRYCEEDDYRYILGDDSNSLSRWEQSIFSLLVKHGNYAFLPDETYWFPDWKRGEFYPIWAMRNRSGGDAFRRNIFDLFQIFLAKSIRGGKKLVNKSPHKRFNK